MVVLVSPGLDFRCMAWACHGHGMHGMAASTRIESRRGARGRGSLNFAGKTMALQAKKSDPPNSEIGPCSTVCNSIPHRTTWPDSRVSRILLRKYESAYTYGSLIILLLHTTQSGSAVQNLSIIYMYLVAWHRS